jgi:type I restriction enzyme, R subunit
MRSLNFEFLKSHEPMLTQLGAAAERYCFEDPNVSLYKLRQFGELLAQLAASSLGLTVTRDANQLSLLRDLESRGAIRGDVQRLFHEIRRTGNEAVHSLVGNQRIALEHLRYACFLGIWFHRSFGDDRDFKAAFIPPKQTVEPEVSLESTLLQKEIARLNASLEAQVPIACDNRSSWKPWPNRSSNRRRRSSRFRQNSRHWKPKPRRLRHRSCKVS